MGVGSLSLSLSLICVYVFINNTYYLIGHAYDLRGSIIGSCGCSTSHVHCKARSGNTTYVDLYGAQKSGGRSTSKFKPFQAPMLEGGNLPHQFPPWSTPSMLFVRGYRGPPPRTTCLSSTSSQYTLSHSIPAHHMQQQRQQRPLSSATPASTSSSSSSRGGPSCTFLKSGRLPMTQTAYHCYTCSRSLNNKIICATCATTCHHSTPFLLIHVTPLILHTLFTNQITTLGEAMRRKAFVSVVLVANAKVCIIISTL